MINMNVYEDIETGLKQAIAYEAAVKEKKISNEEDIVELICDNCELYNKCLMHSLSLAYGKVINASTDRDVLVENLLQKFPEAHQVVMCENFNAMESEADRAYSLLSILDVEGMNSEDLMWMIYRSNRR